jgi:hypothetical protein
MPWPLGEASECWCTREDLNLHALRRPLLRRLRLPFRHECMMVPQRRIERRFPPYQSGALPLDDCGPGLGVVLAGGLEPPTTRLRGECSADELSQPFEN